MFDTLAEVSTRSSNDTDRNKPPLKDLTCVVTFDLLKKVSAAKYGLFTKGRLSLWQCCKTRGGWRATKFYNREVDSTAKVLTQAELKKLAAKLMEMEDFEDASLNMQIILAEWANPAKAEELRQWTAVLKTWYYSIVPEERDRKATIALLFDLCDTMLDMGCEFSTVLADAQRHHRDTTLVFEFMKKEFPYLKFTSSSLQEAPKLVMRHLCREHREELSSEDWPKEWQCECKWNERIERLINAFSTVCVPKTLEAALIRGVPRGGAMPGLPPPLAPGTPNPHAGSSAPPAAGSTAKLPIVYTAAQLRTQRNVGGFTDLIAADTGQQTMNYCRIGNRVLRRAHATEAERALIHKLRGKLPDGAVPCMCDGTFVGCLRNSSPRLTCEFHHGWRETHLSLAEAKGLKMYYAWCMAKGDGLWGEQNAEWLTDADKESKAKTQEALKCKVLATMRASGFGAAGPSRVRDPSASAPGPSTRTRSRAGTAQQEATQYDKVEVAEQGRISDSPTLLPSGLIRAVIKPTLKHRNETVMGVTRIHKKSDFTVVLNTEMGEAFNMCFTVCDSGEQLESGEWRKCEILAEAASGRVTRGADFVRDSKETAARKWFSHNGLKDSSPTWQHVCAALTERDVPEVVWQCQAPVVLSILCRDQPISPEQNAMLLLPHAANYVECKLYHDADDEFHMALGIPTSCVAQDSTLKDVPIVFKYYTPTHACAAVCDPFRTGGNSQSTMKIGWRSTTPRGRACGCMHS
jgi:hypothetical protein